MNNSQEEEKAWADCMPSPWSADRPNLGRAVDAVGLAPHGACRVVVKDAAEVIAQVGALFERLARTNCTSTVIPRNYSHGVMLGLMKRGYTVHQTGSGAYVKFVVCKPLPE